MEFVSGLYKSTVDERDWLLRSFLDDKSIPEKFDLTNKMTPIRSQGQEGSCVGFAMVVGCREYQEQIDYKMFISLSPRFLYEEAKKISGHSEGTTLKAAVEVAKNLGVCREYLWPYVAGYPGIPTPTAKQNAKKHTVKTYARITNITELKQAISDPKIGPVMIGVKVFKGMVSDEIRRDGVVPNPSCWDNMKVLGGHAICAVGYDNNSPYYKNDGHVKIKNSWGLTWGEAGYGYLSYKYIKNHMLDAFSSIDIKGSPNILTVADLNVKESTKAWV